MKMKVGTKILAGYIVVLLLLGVVTYLGVGGLGKQQEDYGKVVNINLPTKCVVWQMQSKEVELRGTVRAFMLYKDEKWETSFEKVDEDFRKEVQELRGLVQTDASKEYVNKLETAHDGYVQEAKKIITAVKANNQADVQKYSASALEYAAKYDKDAGEFIAFVDKVVGEWVATAETNAQSTKQTAMVASIIAIVLGIAIGVFLAKKISTPIVALTEVAQVIAKGDLTSQIPKVTSGDELEDLAGAFNTMTANLRNLIGGISASAQNVAATSEELSSNAEEVSSATQQVAKAVDGLAKSGTEQTKNVNESAVLVNELILAIGQIASGANEQAHNMSQGARMMDEMSKGIEEVASSSQKVAEATRQTAEAAGKGGDAVEKTIAGMDRIRSTVFDSAAKIKELGISSEQIGEIVQVIDDIAEQTNLLALNAAIEAARAGEHGKGFAVVADEVRKLAERSGGSTKEIAKLVQTIQKGTSEAVQSMEVGIKEVEVGTGLADNAGVALRDILKMVAEANEQVQSISAAAEQLSASSVEVVKVVNNMAAITEENTAATEEMAAGSNQVNLSINNIASLSQDSAATTEEVSASTEEVNASAEEIAAAAQSLSKMAVSLQDMVATFRV